MRRLIILLLAVIIPIKAWAGIAQPLALKLNHAGTHTTVLHVGTAADSHASPLAPAQPDCCDQDELSAAVHLHECSHLAMQLLAAPPPLVSFPQASALAPVAPTSHPRSVVHDVLLQPPLLLL